MKDSTAGIATIQMELDIDASVADVWRVLTEQISDWWPDDFYAGGSADKRGFLLEAEPGGRMYEHWDEGGGVLWGTVVTVEPEKSLQVLGNVFPNWGGPTQWYGSWQLSADGKQTKLSFSETALGKVSDEGMREKEKGWQFLCSSLQAYVEGNPPPLW